MSIPSASPAPPIVTIHGDLVTVSGLELRDRSIADHLAGVDEDRRVDELAAAIAIGVRGLGAMAPGSATHRVGEAVERAVGDALAQSETRVAALLESGQQEMERALDPDVRSSITARMMHEFGTVHRELLEGLDPDRRDSATARFVHELNQLLGPDGQLEHRLAAALDPSADGSALSALLGTVETRFQELRDLIVGSTARQAEALRGTTKGFAFEDVVEARLRVEARHLDGAVVERTSTDPGALGNACIVGDCVVTLSDGTRIAIEAKHASRIALTGRDGILDELDRAMTNRRAAWGVCVSHDAAYPEEVGVFGIYGNRILIVDDGSGELIRVALRWINATARRDSTTAGTVDLDRVGAHLERLRALATRFSRTKRALTGVQSSIEAVRSELDELRTELLDGVDDTLSELRADPGSASTSLVA